MKQSRGGATRARIIETSIELFAKFGREAVSVQDICREAKVSNGSLFHHFGSKNGIALAAYLELREDYWSAAMAAMESFEGDPIDALGAAAAAAMVFQEEQGDRYNFMVECGSADWMREHGEPVRALNAKIASRWMAWAGPHLASGKLPMLPPEIYPAIIFGPSQWLARSWQTGLTPTTPKQYIDSLIPLLLKALRPA